MLSASEDARGREALALPAARELLGLSLICAGCGLGADHQRANAVGLCGLQFPLAWALLAVLLAVLRSWSIGYSRRSG